MTSAVRIPYAPVSASTARAQMRADLTDRGLPVDLVDDASLVVTELISNALRHTPVHSRVGAFASPGRSAPVL